MIEDIVMHAPDDAELIRALLQMRERVADLDPALPERVKVCRLPMSFCFFTSVNWSFN
jgi:hypothetical protein